MSTAAMNDFRSLLVSNPEMHERAFDNANSMISMPFLKSDLSPDTGELAHLHSEIASQQQSRPFPALRAHRRTFWSRVESPNARGK